MEEKKLDWKIIAIIISSLIACPILYFFEEQFSQVFRIILESKLLHLTIWIIIVVIYAIHYVKIRRKDISNNMILSTSLPPFMDNFFGAVTYGAIITTTLTLMKGMYIQIAFGEEHFKDFNQFDISSLAIALFFLLWYSLTKIGEDVQEIFWVSQTKSVDINSSKNSIKNPKKIEMKEKE